MTALLPFCFCYLSITAPATEEIDNAYVIASILAHDQQITDLTVDYDVEVGQNRNGRPISIRGRWMGKDQLRRLNEDLVRGDSASRSETAFDGHVTRSLVYSQNPDKSPHSGSQHTTAPRFGKSGIYPRALAGRLIWEQELIPALEQGKATVQQELVEIDGHSCHLIEGQMATQAQDGYDGAYFRLWLDPQHGWMPRRLEEITYGDDGAKSFLRVTTSYVLTEVAPGIWFPSAAMEEGYNGVDGELTREQTNAIRYTTIGVNQGLDKAKFVIEFPTGTKVLNLLDAADPRRGVEYIVGEAQEVDSALDQAIFDAEKMRQEGPPTPEISPQVTSSGRLEHPINNSDRKANHSLILWGAAVVCVAVVVVLIWWFRRNRGPVS